MLDSTVNSHEVFRLLLLQCAELEGYESVAVGVLINVCVYHNHDYQKEGQMVKYSSRAEKIQ
jgi:hypothetical protein